MHTQLICVLNCGVIVPSRFVRFYLQASHLHDFGSNGGSINFWFSLRNLVLSEGYLVQKTSK